MPRPLLAPIASRLLALACLPAAVGCGKPAPEAAPRTQTTAPRTKTFEFEGVVRAVDADQGVVGIAHEDIPGLMPPMLMDFRLEDRTLLDDVIADDEVRGLLEVDYDAQGEITRLELVDLVVTRPAPPRPPGGEPLAPASPPPTLEPGQVVPDLVVTTQRGERLSLSDLEGNVVVLTFIFTRCPQPEFCPLLDRKFGELARRIARSPDRADRVRLLSVSFDPEYDTPEVLAGHARRVGAEPPLWTFAVAEHEALRAVAAPLGLTYAPMTDQIVHSLSTAIIAPDGTLARLELGNAWTPEELYGHVRQVLDAEHP
ncbi:copper-binding protein [Tautonia sp. JC769]|uniref:copper-binding protein n=1 Tax=Tautonia sp. JC769 TaxID=3232135 RepID=UPI003459522B